MIRPDYLTLLVGAWQFRNVTFFYSNGTKWDIPLFSLGKNFTGIIQYSKGVSANTLWVTTILHPINEITNLRPPNVTYDVEESGTQAEWALIGQHNLAYGAPVTMEIFQKGDPAVTTDDEGRLMHGPMKFSNVPSFAGVTLERNFTFLDGGNWLRLRTRDAKSGAFGFFNWGRLM